MAILIAPIPFVDTLLLAPVALGILTLFGRKKKEEKRDEGKPSAAVSRPTEQNPSTPPITGDRSGGPTAHEDEDTSLNGLLKSLISEIPPEESNREGTPFTAQVTPDFVPPRSTPHSRPMVVVSGEKGRKLVEADEAARAQAEEEFEKYSEPVSFEAYDEPGNQGSFAEVDSLSEEVKKLEAEVKKRLEEPPRLEKPARREVVQAEKHQGPAKHEAGPYQILQVAGSSLQSPGFITVSGPQGSGKTVFCLSLAAGYLQKASPCIIVTYDQSPGEARERMRKIGCDPAEFESQFRLLIVDGFSCQSESFSMEPYYVERPLDLTNLKDTITQNTQVFMGERTPVLLDSIDAIMAKGLSKEASKGFRELVDSLKSSGTTFLATIDSEKLSKEDAAMLESLSDCVIDLSKSGTNTGKLLVRKQQGSHAKTGPQTFEFDSSNRMVFS